MIEKKCSFQLRITYYNIGREKQATKKPQKMEEKDKSSTNEHVSKWTTWNPF